MEQLSKDHSVPITPGNPPKLINNKNLFREADENSPTKSSLRKTETNPGILKTGGVSDYFQEQKVYPNSNATGVNID